MSFFIVLLLGSASSSQAQTANFASETFNPSPHADAFFSVESGAIAPSLDVRASLFLNYEYRPLQLYSASGTRLSGVLEHRLSANVLGAISLFDRLSIGLLIPVGLYETNDPSTQATGVIPPAHTTFGDVRIEPKIGLLNQARHYVDLALLATITLPSASRHSFAGDQTVSAGGELDLSRRFGAFRAALNFGYLWRDKVQFYDLTVGQQFYYRAGAGFDLGRLESRPAPLEFIGELYGSAVLQAVNAAGAPLEWLLGFRYSPTDWMQVQAGGGRAILAGFGAPDARAFVGLTFIPVQSRPTPAVAPPPPKNEPASRPVVEAPASKPVIEPPASRPVTDTDKDGIPDEQDKCPKEAGPLSNGGCPDLGPPLIVITKTEIEIKQKVFFESASDHIKKESYNLLNQVAAGIRNHEDIAKVRIEGHTDDLGSEEANLKLSQDRAEAVRAYIIAQGVAPSRLEAYGFGKTKPLAPNVTIKGRELNRRVVFSIVDPNAPPLKPIMLKAKKPTKKAKPKSSGDMPLVMPKQKPDLPLVTPKKRGVQP